MYNNIPTKLKLHIQVSLRPLGAVQSNTMLHVSNY